jgi:glycerol-3-phosphate acyltransferase PlsY
MWYLAFLAALSSYLLGNLNGAVIASTLVAHEDVRTQGSGNAGLTNFIRNYGVQNALLVVLIDAGKAILACFASGMLLNGYGHWLEGKVLGGFFVLLGHVYPVFLGFKGGKGILSGLTIAAMVDWRIALMIAAVFFAVYFTTQYVSLSSVLGCVVFGIGFVVFHHDNLPVCIGGVAMAALAIFMHRSNILRLIRGEERKTNLLSKGKKQ